MSASGSTKAILAALVANAAIAIAKFIGFLITRSSSLLAESIHSVADTSNQALLLWGGKRAKRAATQQHQFGYGRERYFWSFVVALVLFSLGGGFAIFEGIKKIRNPHEIDSLEVAIVILVLGLFLEGYSLNTAIKESRHAKQPDQSWADFIRDARIPELPVVLLEDLGAMAGLAIALSAIVTAELTGDPVWDGVGTLIIGLLLTAIAAVLAREMKSLLIGEGFTEYDETTIVKILNNHGSVAKLIHLRSQHMGPDSVLLAAKVQFEAGLDQAGLADAIDSVEAALRAAVSYDLTIYLEPDLYDAAPQGS